MANIEEKIEAEFDNMISILKELGKVKNRSKEELVILVGIATFLQSIYTGIENILKSTFKKAIDSYLKQPK